MRIDVEAPEGSIAAITRMKIGPSVDVAEFVHDSIKLAERFRNNPSILFSDLYADHGVHWSYVVWKGRLASKDFGRREGNKNLIDKLTRGDVRVDSITWATQGSVLPWEEARQKLEDEVQEST